MNDLNTKQKMIQEENNWPSYQHSSDQYLRD